MGRHPNTTAYFDRRFLIAMTAALMAIVLAVSLTKCFGRDEFEHTHATWYVADGKVPYTDFFENHHPLLWYVLSPLLRAAGETPWTMYLFRLVFYLLTVGIVGATFTLGRRASGSSEGGWLASLYLLSVVMFVEKSVEIRPDVPQVLLGLLAVIWLLDHRRTRRWFPLAASGLAMGMSLLFLQKSLFLTVGCASVLVWDAAKRRIPFGALPVYAICSLMPPMVYWIRLVVTGRFGAYYLVCWQLHTAKFLGFSPLTFLTVSLRANPFFWPVAVAGSLGILARRRVRSEARIIAYLTLPALALVVAAKNPWPQYFLTAFCLLSVCCSCAVRAIAGRFRLGRLTGLAVLLVTVAWPAAGLFSLTNNNVGFGTRHEQLRKVAYVLSHVGPREPVYDGDIRFNIFRPDLHYFWISAQGRRNMYWYNRITGGRFADYDICGEIHAQEPGIVSDYGLDPGECGLLRDYEPTPFEGLYLRRPGLARTPSAPAIE